MREEVGRSFAESILVADRAKDTMQTYLRFVQNNRNEILDMLQPLAGNIIGYIAKWMKNDPFEKVYTGVFSTSIL